MSLKLEQNCWIDKSLADVREKKEFLQQEQLASYQHKHVWSGSPFIKDNMAVKPSWRAYAPCLFLPISYIICEDCAKS